MFDGVTRYTYVYLRIKLNKHIKHFNMYHYLHGKEVMFLVALVCLFVCLSVNITPKGMNGLE